MRGALVGIALMAFALPALAQEPPAFPLLPPIFQPLPLAQQPQPWLRPVVSDKPPVPARQTTPEKPPPVQRAAVPDTPPPARPLTGRERRQAVQRAAAGETPYQALIAAHAKTHNIPESLVHRVVKAESRYNARAVGRGGAMGLMQIKYATARGMGYTGSPSGLLDPETNLTYAVRYLAGAYQAAGGNADGAVSNYRRGYYKSKRRRAVARVEAASPSPLSLFGFAATEPPRRRTRRVRVRRAVAQ